jgi:hypothetical protein
MTRHFSFRRLFCDFLVKNIIIGGCGLLKLIDWRFFMRWQGEAMDRIRRTPPLRLSA